MTTTVKGVTTQTFNRFGVKKKIVFSADNAAEKSYIAAKNAKMVEELSEQEYMQELENA